MERLRKTREDLIPHNLLIIDFGGKNSKSRGIIALEIQVRTISRNTMFVVVPSKANFNLLLGREWIHVVGEVPSTLHQMMFIWNDLNECQIIEVELTAFDTPDTKIFNIDKILVYLGPFKIKQGTDLKRQANEKGEPLTYSHVPNQEIWLSVLPLSYY